MSPVSSPSNSFDTLRIVDPLDREMLFLIEESLIRRDASRFRFWLRPIFTVDAIRGDLDTTCEVNVDGKQYRLSVAAIPYDKNFHSYYVMSSCKIYFEKSNAIVSNYKIHDCRIVNTDATKFENGLGFWEYLDNRIDNFDEFINSEHVDFHTIRYNLQGDVLTYVLHPNYSEKYNTLKKLRNSRNYDGLNIFNDYSFYKLEQLDCKKTTLTKNKIFFYRIGDTRLYLQNSSFSYQWGRYFSVLGKFASDEELLRANPNQLFGFFFFGCHGALDLGLLQYSPAKLDARQTVEPIYRSRLMLPGDVAKCYLKFPGEPYARKDFLTAETSRFGFGVGESVHCLKFFAMTDWTPESCYTTAVDLNWANSVQYDNKLLAEYFSKFPQITPTLPIDQVGKLAMEPSPDPRFSSDA